MKRKPKFKELDQKPLRKATLCFLLRKSGNKQEILLARKKRGFGAGKYNGVGGKADEANGETVEEAANREIFEEVGVRAKDLFKVAVLRFFFPFVPEDKDWNQEVHVFLVDDWEGKPAESEEMAPEWFDIEKLPFENMWSDDFLWLPRVLKGEKLTGKFIFGENESITDFEITFGLPKQE